MITKQSTPEQQTKKGLQKMDLKINAFGDLLTSIDIDRVNAFLNKNVVDKKLVGRKMEGEKVAE